ncbi:MAG: TetR/AcrR family transcriptional regulator [Anaerolineae bacterium]|nr:TetR/AcrR family transcriptional regulator [Anaerolineae bacterium]
MPYPSLIDRDRIVETARELIETQGIDAVTLRVVADALGVKAPSLYRHVKHKNAMLLAVNEVTLRELIAVMMDAVDSPAPLVARLVTVATAYRDYAHAHPVCYELAMSSNPEIKPAQDVQVQMVLPLQALFAQLTDGADSLAALRGAYAFLHGWVSLEINQQLRRGGDLGSHFEQSFRAYLAGWEG